MVEEILLGLQEPFKSGKPKSMDYRVVLQVIGTNLSSTQRDQLSSASHNQTQFITFATMVKASGVAKLWLIYQNTAELLTSPWT